MRKVLAAIALVALFLVADVVLLVWLGTLVGFWPAVGLVLVSAALGGWLAKREGLRVLDDARDALGRGRLPEEGLTGGLLVLAGGLLLVTPGVLTDVVGVALLIPPSRRWIAARLRHAFERWWQRRTAGPAAAVPAADGSVAAEVVDFGESASDPRARSGDGMPGFTVFSFTTRGGPVVWTSAGSRPRNRPSAGAHDIIDVEAEEVLGDDLVPPSRRLPG